MGLPEIRGHEFYRLYSHSPVEGILVGQHNIPIDQNILREAVRLGSDPEYSRECLLTNKHNAATTTYYLLLKQRHESGFQSIADINSSRFDPALLAYHPARSATPTSQQRPRQRSSVDKFLQIELQEAFGGLEKQRKGSFGMEASKRYAKLVDLEGKGRRSRSNVRSKLQQSYEVQNHSMSKEREELKLSERDVKIRGIINLPSLNRRNQRKVHISRQ